MIKQTRAELEALPLKILRGLDITTIEEEKMIQEIILSKTGVPETLAKFNQRLVPDIKDVNQEKEWQAKINEFNTKHTPVEAKIAQAEKTLETVKEEVKTEAKPVVVPMVVTVKDGEIIKPFCDLCDSKGVRHKKDCPNK